MAKKANQKPASGAKPAAENTVGQIVPKTAPAPAGAAPSPPVKPETPKEKGLLEKADELLEKGEIKVLNDAKNSVAGGIDSLVNLAGGGAAAQVVGAIGKGAVEVLFPTNVIDIIPGGKILSGGKKAAKIAEKLGKEAAEKAKKEAVEKAAKEAAEKKAKDAAKDEAKKADVSGNKGGNSKAKVKQEPHKDCGRKQPYSDKKGVKGTGLEKDHTPSSKALKAAAMKEMEPLIKAGTLKKAAAEKIANAVSEKAPTIAIPHDVHKAGQTWGSGKNTPAQIAQDAGDLNGAAKRNTEKISEIMADKKHGCNDAYNKAAEEITSMDWNKFVKDTIADKLPKPKT
jgi:hypothetical protein